MSERYEIRRMIAEGGVGVVYEAWDTQLERTVAIKMMRKTEPGELDTTGPQNTPDSLLREARSMSALQHPNIISVYDVGETNSGEPFVVMEFLTGETLTHTVTRARLPLDDFKRIANQCLQGLVAAHRKGFIHRDLKPSNIMLVWHSDEYQVKLLDFGLAKFSRNAAHQTIDHGGAVMGSIHFMAPEQFERVPLDERTDLYQLGCVFYFSLTGVYPFEGETAAEVMVSHLQHHIVPLSELRPDLPEWVCLWLHSLIHRDRDARIASAQLALALLEAEKVASDVSECVPESATSPLPKKIPTHAVAAGFPKPTSHIPTVSSANSAAARIPAPTIEVSMADPPPHSNSFGWSKGLVAALIVVFVGVGVLMLARNNPSPRRVATNAPPPATGTFDDASTSGLSHSSPDSISTPRSMSGSSSTTAASSSSKTHDSETRMNSDRNGERPLSTSSAPQDKVLNPSDVNEIKAQLGRFVTLEGSIVRVGESKTGKTRYVNFSRVRDESIAVAIFVEKMGESFPMSRLESLVGRTVRVRGQVRDVFGETLVYLDAPDSFDVLP